MKSDGNATAAAHLRLCLGWGGGGSRPGAVRATRGCHVRQHRSGQGGRGQPRDWGGDPGGREDPGKKTKQTEAQNLQEARLVMFPRGRTQQQWLQLKYGETPRKLLRCEAGVVVSEVYREESGYGDWVKQVTGNERKKLPVIQ